MAKRAPRQRCRQHEGSQKRAENEERKGHHHAAGPAAEAEQHAGPAAIGKLHADAEKERADDQRDRYRGDRSRRIQPHCRRAKKDKGAQADQQEMRGQPHRLAAGEKPPPGRCEPVLKAEKDSPQRAAKGKQGHTPPACVQRHQSGKDKPGNADHRDRPAFIDHRRCCGSRWFGHVTILKSVTQKRSDAGGS